MTDVKDAGWITTTLIKDLPKENFVPDETRERDERQKLHSAKSC